MKALRINIQVKEMIKMLLIDQKSWQMIQKSKLSQNHNNSSSKNTPYSHLQDKVKPCLQFFHPKSCTRVIRMLLPNIFPNNRKNLKTLTTTTIITVMLITIITIRVWQT